MSPMLALCRTRAALEPRGDNSVEGHGHQSCRQRAKCGGAEPGAAVGWVGLGVIIKGCSDVRLSVVRRAERRIGGERFQKGRQEVSDRA